MKQASHKSIERLSMYRRLLQAAKGGGTTSVYSYNLADMIGGTAAQVRRDLMEIGYAGNPKTGYDVDDLIKCIGDFLDDPEGERIALVGVGNLGRALLDYFASQHPKLKIVAAFDNDPQKTGRVINGCRCYPIEGAAETIAERGIRVAIMAVPVAVAQAVSEQLVKSGIRGFLNFAPEPLHVPPRVSVENIDMTMALEKTAFLARQIETSQ